MAPVNTVAPVASGTSGIGNLYSVTNGTWTGDATIVFTYKWQRAGVDIGGATSNTYTQVALDIGASITCVVTGANAIGNASASSNALLYYPSLMTSAAIAAIYDPIPANVTTVGSGPVTVDVLNDSTANANHMSAASAGVRPTLLTTFNGQSQPCIEFDGASWYLRRASFAWPSGTPTAHTLIVVAQILTSTNNRVVLGGVRPQLDVSNTGASHYYAIAGQASPADMSATDWVAGGAAACSINTWDGSLAKAYAANTLRATQAAVGLHQASPQTMGMGASGTGTTPANCRVAFAMLLAGEISAGDRANMAAYSTNRWGTP